LKSHLLISIFCLLLCLTGSTARATETTTTTPAVPANNENLSGDTGYEIGPGDVLHINVWRQDDITGDYTVSADGEISMPLVGTIKLRGMTAEGVRQLLMEKYGAKYLRNPQIRVKIKDFQNFKIFVMGAVAKPGEYRFGRKTSLLDALITAGGPTEKAGDRATIFRRKDGGDQLVTISSDLRKLFSEEDLSQNIALRNGDVLFISRVDAGSATFRFLDRSTNQFAVVGQVKKPGTYDFVEGYSVLNAILSAGGLDEFASPNGTTIIRRENGNTIKIEALMGDVMYDGETESDKPIKAGDLIIVPKGLF
jgi:polysaccharide biosynthesis/export protein